MVWGGGGAAGGDLGSPASKKRIGNGKTASAARVHHRRPTADAGVFGGGGRIGANDGGDDVGKKVTQGLGLLDIGKLPPPTSAFSAAMQACEVLLPNLALNFMSFEVFFILYVCISKLR